MSKILIVDDDPDLVEAVTMILESKDYDVSPLMAESRGLRRRRPGSQI